MRALMALALLATLAAAPARAGAEEAPRVESLKWMTGCWGFETPGGRYEEFWTTPTVNSMLGLSRRTEDGVTREFEYMRIVTSGGGGFDFIAKPRDQEETRFNSLSVAAHRIVFENPEHDFPKKIIYEFTPPDQLKARIEGVSNGQPMGMNFPMKRRSCP